MLESANLNRMESLRRSRLVVGQVGEPVTTTSLVELCRQLRDSLRQIMDLVPSEDMGYDHQPVLLAQVVGPKARKWLEFSAFCVKLAAPPVSSQ